MADRIQPFLGKSFGFIPLFEGPPLGLGMLTAGIILGIMIFRFITAMIREIYLMVPDHVKESA